MPTAVIADTMLAGYQTMKIVTKLERSLDASAMHSGRVGRIFAWGAEAGVDHFAALF